MTPTGFHLHQVAKDLVELTVPEHKLTRKPIVQRLDILDMGVFQPVSLGLIGPRSLVRNVTRSTGRATRLPYPDWFYTHEIPGSAMTSEILSVISLVPRPKSIILPPGIARFKEGEYRRSVHCRVHEGGSSVVFECRPGVDHLYTHIRSLPWRRKDGARGLGGVRLDSIGGTDGSAGLHRLDVGRGGKGLTFDVSTPNVTHLNGLVDWSPASSSEAGRVPL